MLLTDTISHICIGCLVLTDTNSVFVSVGSLNRYKMDQNYFISELNFSVCIGFFEEPIQKMNLCIGCTTDTEESENLCRLDQCLPDVRH